MKNLGIHQNLWVKYDRALSSEKTEMGRKPGFVLNHHSSRIIVTNNLEHSTPLSRTGRPLALARLTGLFELAPRRVYLISLQQAEAPVHPFCCTCPHLTVDGRYPLRCHMVPGLSSRTCVPAMIPPSRKNLYLINRP